MKKLAEKEYWDSVYNGINDKKSGRFYKIRQYLKEITRDYSNFVMWDILIPKFLPKISGLKIIEIGCAPGKYLINFNKKFGYEPYGVEYSERGVEIAKENFVKADLNPENIIQRDFFDPTFQSEYKEKFDLVFSRGFIEHYDDVKSVVDRHVSLVKSGGFVVVSIPNLSGINDLLARFFNIDSYRLHNTSIMKKNVFADLFDNKEVEQIYCDYVGVFSFGMFNTNRRWKRFLHKILIIMQRPVDCLLRIFTFSNILKNQYLSPYLLFVGRKR